jgi:hypothetical protein
LLQLLKPIKRDPDLLGRLVGGVRVSGDNQKLFSAGVMSYEGSPRKFRIAISSIASFLGFANPKLD